MRLPCFGLILLLLDAATAIAAAADLPEIFTASPQGLARIKALVPSDDNSVKAAVAKLRRDADKAMKVRPQSVMEKTTVPPSGDKHDYMSFAPYFWPDPGKADGMPYIRRDGEVNPERSRGDSGPLGRMASSVETLALAYCLTGNESYAEHATKLLRVWFLDPAKKMNPNLNFGQGIPGATTGRPTGIIDTRGLIELCDAAGLLATYRGWTAQDRAGLSDWFKQYVAWLRTSKLGVGEGKASNNHGSWYDAQEATMAMYYGDRELAKRVIEAGKRRIDAQVKPDGSQPAELARTKSFGYSLYNLRALMTLASLGDRVSEDLWHYQGKNGGGIRAALDYLARYADPNEKWPHKELHFDRSALIPVLLEARAVYGNDAYQKLLDRFPAESVAENRANLLPKR